MRSKIMLGIVGIAVALAIVVPAALGSLPMNYGYSWEDLAGARVNGYVQIQASYNDNGLHARQGYHHFWRQAGPALDKTYFTTEATSPYDSEIRSRQDSVWDSPLWGDAYVTHWGYNFLWF